MNTIKQTIFYTCLTVFVSLLQGCSSHTLQDLIDGNGDTDKQTNESSNVAPSQNNALNAISPSRSSRNENREDGYLQKTTDTWVEEEWEPLTESNTSSQKIEVSKVSTDVNATESDHNSTNSDDTNNSFTLQHYVDKAGVYFDNKERRDANKTKVPSHIDKVNAMPGIGKSDQRR